MEVKKYDSRNLNCSPNTYLKKQKSNIHNQDWYSFYTSETFDN